MTIKQITESVQNKIVASSSIVTPLSAVKELIENSIDSSAKNISIDIDSRTGGCDYISVRDDGPGVNKEDRSMMCLNHSTSKIENYNDLPFLRTLGFRGEALFLIACLATERGSMEICTKCNDEPIGERWFIDKMGKVKQNKFMKASCQDGTSVIVRKLLGGLRSRQIEMASKAKKTVDELRHLINHYSMINRDIRFTYSLISLNKNGLIERKQLQYSADVKLSRTRLLSQIVHLRRSQTVNFFEIDSIQVNSYIRIHAIFPRMTYDSEVMNLRKSSKFLSVNDRVMTTKIGFGKTISKMLDRVYHSLDWNEPKVWYLDITCDGKFMDINIEPEKNDILIKNADDMTENIEKSIQAVLVKELQVVDKIEEVSKSIMKEEKKPQRQSPSIIEDSKETEKNEEDMGDSITIVNDVIGDSESITEPIEVYENGPGRSLTKDSLVSNEIGWQKNYLHDTDPDSQGTTKYMSDNIESSLTYNFKDTDSALNDDLELSKDNSVSNPFAITKLKQVLEKGRRKDKLASKVTTFPLLQNYNNPDTVDFSTLMNKKRKLTDSEETELKKLQRESCIPIKKQRQKNQLNFTSQYPIKNRLTRHISMFSEYTNSLQINSRYSLDIKSSLSAHKLEQKWINQSNVVPISQSIQETLSELLKNEGSAQAQLQHKYTVSAVGWHIFQ